MAVNHRQLEGKHSKRSRIDKLVSTLITLGGWTVLLMLATMIWHLMKVAAPLVSGANISMEEKISFEENETVLFMGDLLEGEALYSRSAQCDLNSFLLDDETQQLRHAYSIPFACDTQLQIAKHQGHIYLFSLTKGGLLRIEQIRTDKYHIMRDAIATLAIPEHEEQSAWQAALSEDLVMVASKLKNEWRVISQSRENPQERRVKTFSEAERLLLMPSLGRAVLASTDSVMIYAAQSNTLQRIELTSPSSFLASANSDHAFVLGLENGYLQKWVVVNRQGELAFELNYEMFVGANIHSYWQDVREHLGLISTENHQLILFNDLTGERVEQEKLRENLAHIEYVEDKFYLHKDREIEVLMINNPSAGINYSSLWKAIRYAGYESSSHVWQSAASEGLEPKYSLIPLFIGSLKAALYGLIIAVPLALGAAIYSAYYLSPKLRGFVKPTIELLEAIPSVVIAFIVSIWLTSWDVKGVYLLLACLVFSPVALLLASYLQTLLSRRFSNYSFQGRELFFVPIFMLLFLLLAHGLWESFLYQWDVNAIQAGLGPNFAGSKGTLVVSIALAIAIVPTIYTLAEDAIFGVPMHYQQASFALGATKLQTLNKVVLKAALPGIVSAVMLGFGRAFGETMIVLMVTGNTPVADWGIFSGLRTLGANLAIELPHSEVGSGHYRILFMMALLLFCFTFIINTIAEVIRNRFYSRYEHA